MCASSRDLSVCATPLACRDQLRQGSSRRPLSEAQAMSAGILESEAVFEGRAVHMGLSSATIADLKARGLRTLASYAFSSSYIPGSADDRAFREGVLVPVLGRADHPEAAPMRRLLFEAYTLSAAELRSRLDRQSEDAPRRLPQVERHARFQRLQRSLPDILISGPYEPAHALVDVFADFVETGTVKYVPWNECLSRDQEVNLVKTTKSKEFKRDPATGFIKVDEKADLPEADLGSDLKLVQALARRGIAMDIAGVMSFRIHDELVRLLIREFQRPAPVTHAPLTYIHLERADREVFRRLAEECRSGLVPDTAGVKPMDRALPMILLELNFRMLLVPSLKAGGGGGRSQDQSSSSQPSGDGAGQAKKSKSKVRKEKMKAKIDALKQVAAGKTAAPPQPSSVPKQLGRMPRQLVGQNSKTPSGKMICYAYNLGTCSVTGPRCPKGEHLCVSCFEAHAYVADHPK